MCFLKSFIRMLAFSLAETEGKEMEMHPLLQKSSLYLHSLRILRLEDRVQTLTV